MASHEHPLRGEGGGSANGPLPASPAWPAPPAPPASPASLEVLVFELSGQRYALPSADVREVTRAVTVAALPKAPAIVEGVVNVRGSVVAVLDIRSRFGLPKKEIAPADHLIIARSGPRTVAVRADRAIDLVYLRAEDIDFSLRSAPGVEHVAGVAKTADGVVILHDLHAFLSEAEALALDRAQAGEAP